MGGAWAGLRPYKKINRKEFMKKQRTYRKEFVLFVGLALYFLPMWIMATFYNGFVGIIWLFLGWIPSVFVMLYLDEDIIKK